MELRISSDRLRARFDRFNRIGATDRGGVNRPSLSDANRAARDQLVEWLEAAGMSVTIDEMGNIFGRREGTEDSLPPVLVGSHVDSQYNGGRFDGVIGVLGALEIIETLNEEEIPTSRPVEIVSWSNEEGVRFQPDMLGSGVFAGKFDCEFAHNRTDADGYRFGDELDRIGYKGNTPCDPRDLHCYVEMHVEQGPLLEEAGLSVGVVEGVVGFVWVKVTFEGQADHAGPTPMTDRHDALVAASDIVRTVRRLAVDDESDLVGTVGTLDVSPNAINVVPERVELTVDLRSHDAGRIDRVLEKIRTQIERSARREGVSADYEELMRVAPQTFNPECVEVIERAAKEVGASSMRLSSGAGHDASYLNQICPTSMVFVPSVNGVSHTEDEFTKWEDVVAGTNVLLHSVLAKASEGTAR